MDEKKKLFQSLLFPALFLIIIWLVKITEIVLNINFVYLGLYPLKWSGLIGILTAPLIHADLRHLFDNSIPVFLLSTAIFYFYSPVALQSILSELDHHRDNGLAGRTVVISHRGKRTYL